MTSGFASIARVISRVLAVAVFTLGFAGAAHADCSTPTGVEGEIIYNDDSNLVQYCDGTTWVRMGASADSRIGTLTASKWCTTDGTTITCTQNTPTGVAGSDKQVQFNDGGSTLGGASQMFWDKTNNRMGVNVGTPTQAIDVSGKVTADGVLLKKISGMGAPVGSGVAGGTGGQVQFNDNGTSLSGDTNFVWDNTYKRLGIGTASPGASLALSFTSGSGSNPAAIFTYAGAGASDFDLIRNSTANGQTARTFRIRGGNDFDAFTSFSLGMVSNHPLRFMTNDSERMRIDASGNVGIGTASPTNILTLERSANDAESQLLLSNPSAGGTARVGLIATRNGGTVLALFNAGAETSLRSVAASHSLAFYTANTSRMTISSAGDVGIGTASPGSKLEVNGQVKITGGSPGAGKVLTSDAAGLATWTAPSAGGITAVTTATCAYGSFCTVSCPATYFRTGCSADNGDGGSEPSGSGCKCTGTSGGNCYAYCAK